MKATIDGVLLEGTVEEIVLFLKQTKPQIKTTVIPTIDKKEVKMFTPGYKPRGRKAVKLKVTDTNGDCRIYPSINQFCLHTGVPRETVRKAIDKNKVLDYNGWHIEKTN